MGDQMASACGLKQQNADEGTLLANSTAKFPTHATPEVPQHELQLVIFTSLNIRVSTFLGGKTATVIF